MVSRVLCLFIIVGMFGCKKRLSNPEAHDPIYVDMQKDLRMFEHMAGEELKKLRTAEGDLINAEPRSLDRKNAQSDLLKAENNLKKAKEMIEYYNIRLIQRKYDSEKRYEEAFTSGAPWPPAGEYDAYMINKKLTHASKNWSDRVPRPARQIDPASETAPAEADDNSKN